MVVIVVAKEGKVMNRDFHRIQCTSYILYRIRLINVKGMSYEITI